MADNSRNILLYLLSLFETRSIFPKLYDGFREIEAISKAEDYLADVMRDCVKVCASDKFVSLMNEQKLAAWEHELGLSDSGLTIVQRRAQMVSFLNRNRPNNDANVLSKARTAAGTNNLDVMTDCNQLTMQVLKTANDSGTGEDTQIKNALTALLPYIPQNLSLTGGVRANSSFGIYDTYGWSNSIECELGTAKYILPPILYHLIDMQTGIETDGKDDPSIESLNSAGSMISGTQQVVDMSANEISRSAESLNSAGSMISGTQQVVDMSANEISRSAESLNSAGSMISGTQQVVDMSANEISRYNILGL